MPPDPPLRLKATQSKIDGRQAFLVWQPAPGVASSGFYVYRGTSENGPFVPLQDQPTRTPTYLDTDLKPGVTYYYFVVALNVVGESSPSDTVSLAPPAEAPPVVPTPRPTPRPQPIPPQNPPAGNGDVTPPLVTIENPPPPKQVSTAGPTPKLVTRMAMLRKLVEFSGTITEQRGAENQPISGVKEVRLTLSRVHGSVENPSMKFPWNGKEWGQSSGAWGHLTVVPVADAPLETVYWNMSMSDGLPPSASMLPGQYLLEAVGYDRAGNASPIVKAPFIYLPMSMRPGPAPTPEITTDLEIKPAESDTYIGTDVAFNRAAAEERDRLQPKWPSGAGWVRVMGIESPQSVLVDIGEVNKTYVYHLRLRSKTGQNATLNLKHSGGNDGWKVRYFDSVRGGKEITSKITDEGWKVTLLANTALEFRLELTPTEDALKDVIVRVSASGEDEVGVRMGVPQWIASLQWRDSESIPWAPIPTEGLVQHQNASFLIKAIKGRPEAAWPRIPTRYPKWDNGIKGDIGSLTDELVGWYEKPGEPVTIKARCGNELSVNVRIVTVYELDVWSGKPKISLKPEKEKHLTTVTALVTDIKGRTQEGVTVRFTTTSGTFTQTGTQVVTALTRKNGYASVRFSSEGAKEGDTQADILAEVIVTEGSPDKGTVSVKFE